MTDLIHIFSHDRDQIFEFKTAGMIPPNKIIFGFNALERLGSESMSLAPGKVLLVSDQTLVEMGVVSRASELLSEAGLIVETYTDVEPEPHLETVEAIYERCRADNFSLVVGIGGGSVMDSAKLTAQASAHGIPPADFVNSKTTPESRGLPLVLLPTTSGTGSEVSPILVVAIGDEKKFLYNPFFYPDLAIIDPQLTVSLPPGITASTGIDALSHAIEAMFHKAASPLSDSFCLSSIEMIGTYLRRAVADGNDLESRYYMSMAATLGMMGMANCGALYAHSASYVIAKYKPTSHGVGAALGLPYTMAFNLPVCVDRLGRIAAALGEKTSLCSNWKGANLAIQAVAELMVDVGIPVSLKEYGGIDKNDLEEMAGIMMEKYYRPMNPRPMSQEDAVIFWHNMWEGKY